MRGLDNLLRDWNDDDEDTSDVHIEEFHYHAPSIPDSEPSAFPSSEEPTKDYTIKRGDSDRPTVVVETPKPKVSFRPSMSPQAKKIAGIITGIALGVAAAVKILWDMWTTLKK